MQRIALRRGPARILAVVLFLGMVLAACSWNDIGQGLYNTGKRMCQDEQRVCGPTKN